MARGFVNRDDFRDQTSPGGAAGINSNITMANVFSAFLSAKDMQTAIDGVTNMLREATKGGFDVTEGEVQDEAKRLVNALILAQNKIQEDLAAGRGVTPDVFGSQFGKVIADTTDIQKKLTQSSRDVKNVFDKISLS